MAQRMAAWVALGAVLLAPLAFSLHLLSFLHAKELAYALALVLLAALARPTRDTGSIPRWIVVLLCWLTLVALFAIASGPHFRAPLDKWARAVLVITFFLAAWNALHRTDRLLWLWRALWGSGALAAVLGLLQYFHLLDAWLPVFPHYDQRMYSVFGNQDLLGGYLALTLPFALATAVRGSRTERFAALAALGLMFPALLLSGARSAWLAGGIAALGLLLVEAWPRGGDAQRNPRAGRALLVLLVVAAVVATPWWLPRASGTFGANDTGGNLRIWFYAGTTHMLQAHPWLGVGFGQFGYHSPAHLGAVLHAPGGGDYARNELFTDHAHSDPLETLAEVGVFGVALLIAMLVWALRGARIRPGATAAFASVVALLVLSLFNPTLHSAPHALVGLFSLAALLDVAPAKRITLRPLLGFAPLLAALWLYTTLLPSARLARLEDARLAPCDGLAAYETLLHRFHGPPQAYEGALYAAMDCAYPGQESSPDKRLEMLIAAGARSNDTGTFHRAIARYFVRVGVTVRAGEAYRKVLERWPDNAEAKAFLESATAPPAGSADPR